MASYRLAHYVSDRATGRGFMEMSSGDLEELTLPIGRLAAIQALDVASQMPAGATSSSETT